MSKWIKLLLWVAGIVSVLCGWWYLGHYPLREYANATKDDVINPGTFGDSFGFINSLFSSLAFAIAMIAVAIQSSQNRKAIEIQERTLNSQNAQLVMELFVRIRKHVAQLRESWIDCSEHADSPEDQRKYQIAFDSVKDALDDDVLAAELMFKNSGKEFRRAINVMYEYIKRHPRATQPGSRHSEIANEFYNEMADIDMLIDHVWQQQPGVAVKDEPLDQSNGSPAPEFDRAR